MEQMSQIDKNIACNLKRIRKSQNMSLDMLAEKTGVSKSMLGQIERGESNPTVATISKIIEGIKVPFEDLIYVRKDSVTIMKHTETPTYREEKGEYCIKVIFPFDKDRKFEVFSAVIEPKATCYSDSHGENTCEYVTVQNGELDMTIGESVYNISAGNTVRFTSNMKHSYYNPGVEPLYLEIVLSNELNVVL